MKKDKRKRYVRIDRETGSNEEEIESEVESDVVNLLEDSDTELIAVEEIPDTNEYTHQLLTLSHLFMLKAKAMEVNHHKRKN